MKRYNNKPSKRIFLSSPHMSGKEMKFIRKAFQSNYIAPEGPQIDEFETKLSKRIGIPYVLAVSSGTAAMHLALRCLGVGPGDEVIASSFTFIGSVSPIVFQGGTPLFIDSDRISWNMDPDLLEKEIEACEKRGKRPRAVIPTDIYGQCVDMDRICKICSRYDIPVIADAAESMGALYKGRSAGVGAKAAVYSFNGNKIITTSGGGALASTDKTLIKYARFLSQQARDNAVYYEHSQIGYNYRMTNIVAAVGLGQLTVLDERVRARRKIFDTYKQKLNDLPGIEFMPEASYGRSTRWLTVILISPDKFGADNERVRLALEAHNIESRPIWKPMHLQPVFKGCRMRGGSVSEDFFKRGLCLPSGSTMTAKDIDKVVRVIRNLHKHK